MLLLVAFNFNALSQGLLIDDLNACIDSAKVSNEDLAEYTGTTEWFVAEVRDGRMPLSVETARLIADRLGAYLCKDGAGNWRMKYASYTVKYFFRHGDLCFFWELYEGVSDAQLEKLSKIDNLSDAQRLALKYSLRIIEDGNPKASSVRRNLTKEIIIRKKQKS